MGRFAKKLVLLIALCVCCYMAAITLMAAMGLGSLVPTIIDKSNSGFESNRLAEAEHMREPVDVVFLGSSEVFTGFDPRAFDSLGWRSYNLGSNAQTPVNSLLVYDRWVKPLKPRLVIFDTYWKVFEIDGSESQIDILTNDTLQLADVWHSAIRFKNMEVINTFLYSYVRQRLFHCYPKPQGDNGRAAHYAGRGYVENSKLQSDSLRFEGRKLKLVDWQFGYFETLLASCREDGIQVFLVKTPVTQAYYNSILDRDAFFARIREIGARYGARFVDFNDMVLDQHSDFIDKNHLSTRGVVKFNAVVAHWLSDSLGFRQMEYGRHKHE